MEDKKKLTKEEKKALRKQKRKNISKEFKEFISRGSVLDLAVGVIVGGAFTKIVNSLTNDVLMPFIVGLGVAFVLNVLVNVVEKKWLKNWQISTITKRAVSLLIALILVIVN